MILIEQQPIVLRRQLNWPWLVCAVLMVCMAGCDKSSLLVAGPVLERVTQDGFSVAWWPYEARESFLCVRTGSDEVMRIAARREGDRMMARVTGLAPSEQVDYWIEENGTRIEGSDGPWRAQTAKTADETWSAIVLGDSGGGEKRQYKLAEAMTRYDTDLFLHAGDVVYGDRGWKDYQQAFFKPYAPLLGKMPIYPVLGNHDVRDDGGTDFLKTFDLPANGPDGMDSGRCYWVDYANARIAFLDSNLPIDVLQKEVAPWLKEVLSGGDALWKFVVFHHPPYSGEAYPQKTAIRDALVPVFEEVGVDMVFGGHAHLYERTLPLRQGQPVTKGGIVYITTGAGGRSLREERNFPPNYMAAFDDLHDSFTVLTVSGGMLHVKQIGNKNNVLDQVTLMKPGGA